MPALRYTRPWLGLILVVLLAPCSGAAGEIVPLSDAQQQALKIAWAPPQPVSEQRSRRYPAAVVVPQAQLRVITAPWNGVIERLHVAEGEEVSAGQVLAELRSPGVLEAQRAYLEASLRLELAQRERDRDRTLQREGIIPERRLLESEAHYREQSALVSQQRQLLEMTGFSAADLATLTQTRRLVSVVPIRAPSNGVVLERLVSTGQSVDNATALYRLGQLDPLWLEIRVPVEQVADLALGARVWPTANPELVGRVITIGHGVNASDQGVVVRAEIPAPQGRLRPGQLVEAQWATVTATTSWRLPAAALARQGGAIYIFVARPAGFAPLAVTLLGQEDQDIVLSTAALRAEDRVAVAGVAALKAAWLGSE